MAVEWPRQAQLGLRRKDLPLRVVFWATTRAPFGRVPLIGYNQFPNDLVNCELHAVGFGPCASIGTRVNCGKESLMRLAESVEVDGRCHAYDALKQQT